MAYLSHNITIMTLNVIVSIHQLKTNIDRINILKMIPQKAVYKKLTSNTMV